MATTRFGHLDDFTLKNSKVGIGTSDPTEALEVIGGSRSKDIAVTGIATLTSYEGFQNKKTSYVDNVNITGGESGTLSGEVVIGAGLTMSVGTGATTGQGSIKSLKVSNTFTPPIGGTNERPSAPLPGALYYNKDFRTIEYWDGSFWRQVDNTTSMGRGYVSGGHPGNWNSMELINIPSKGNAVHFGVLGPSSGYINRHNHSQTSNATRGLILGGRAAPVYTPQTIAFTLSTTGNTFDWGDLTQSRGYTGSCASSTRSLTMSGYESPTTNSSHNVIDYFEFSTKGNAVDFGDLSSAIYGGSSASSPTRGFYIGGNPSSPSPAAQAIQSVTIASTGNAQDFGNLNTGRRNTGSFSNSVRACTGGGQINPSSTAFALAIDYFTMASDGNAVHFGDLSQKRAQIAGASTHTRGIILGGYDNSDPAVTLNSIEYVEIMTSGNAMDFGDLYTGRYGTAASSDSHGGLGGF